MLSKGESLLFDWSDGAHGASYGRRGAYNDDNQSRRWGSRWSLLVAAAHPLPHGPGGVLPLTRRIGGPDGPEPGPTRTPQQQQQQQQQGDWPYKWPVHDKQQLSAGGQSQAGQHHQESEYFTLLK